MLFEYIFFRIYKKKIIEMLDFIHELILDTYIRNKGLE